jgi:hypothetical protein
MLLGDIKAQKEKAVAANQTLDNHLKEKKLSDCIVAYSDKVFRQATIEWLVITDQVCATFILSIFYE